jgi:hypothetical protein
MFENEHIKIEIIDGIMHGTYKKGFKITLEDAKNIVEERSKLLGGKDLHAIIYDGGVVSMDKAARDFLSSDEGIKGLKSVAIIENSFFSKMLINFFLKLTNPKIQVKAFGNQEDALKWLKSLD